MCASVFLFSNFNEMLLECFDPMDTISHKINIYICRGEINDVLPNTKTLVCISTLWLPSTISLIQENLAKRLPQLAILVFSDCGWLKNAQKVAVSVYYLVFPWNNSLLHL